MNMSIQTCQAIQLSETDEYTSITNAKNDGIVKSGHLFCIDGFS